MCAAEQWRLALRPSPTMVLHHKYWLHDKMPWPEGINLEYKMPWSEGIHLEYKAAYNPMLLRKYKEVVCALLNEPGGGCLVFGVRDDLTIIGFTPSSGHKGSGRPKPSLDSVKLAMDALLSELVLADGTPLPARAVEVVPIQLTAYAYVVVVKCVLWGPVATQRVYMQVNGDTYTRLNASNVRVKSGLRFVKEAELKEKLQEKDREHETDLQEKNRQHAAELLRLEGEHKVELARAVCRASETLYDFYAKEKDLTAKPRSQLRVRLWRFVVSVILLLVMVLVSRAMNLGKLYPSPSLRRHRVAQMSRPD